MAFFATCSEARWAAKGVDFFEPLNPDLPALPQQIASPFKLVMVTTLDGTPYSFELVPAHTDERDAADELLDTLPPQSHVWSDKGFIGAAWQAEWAHQGVYVWTAKRRNQHDQNPPESDRLLNRVRERIEGAFDILKEGGRSVEHTLAHTIDGLCARIIAKISSVTLRLFLRRFFGIDTVTYTANA